jgi:hypothetical protein
MEKIEKKEEEKGRAAERRSKNKTKEHKNNKEME